MPEPKTFKELAVAAIGRGLRVVRLKPGEKRPVASAWADEASVSEKQVELWDRENPAYGCGAVVQPEYGYWVVDVDSVSWFMAERPEDVPPPNTYTVKTGSGGRHFYFKGRGPFDGIKHAKNPDPERYKKGTGKECSNVMDVICGGGQVLVAGMVHPETGQEYEVAKDLPIQEAHPKFVAWVKAAVESKRPKAQGDKKESSILVDRSVDVERRLSDAGLRYERQERDGAAYLMYHQAYGKCLVKGGKHHNDAGGEEGNGQCAFIVRDLGHAWDVGHQCFSCGGTSTIQALAALGIDFGEIEHKAGRRRMELERADSIPLEPVKWLWPRYVPLERLTSFAGLQGEGKSPVTRSLIAKVTTGADWPDGAKNELGARDVILISFEDDWNSVILPALVAEGADLARVHRPRMTQTRKDAEPFEVSIALDQDIEEIVRVAREVKAALIVIDPATSFLGKLDPNKEEQIRPRLDALAAGCKENEMALIFTGHLNKKVELSSAQLRMMGCAAWTGVPRSNLFASSDPDAPEQEQYAHLMVPHRTPDKGPALKYKTKKVKVPVEGVELEAVIVEWGEESDEVSEIVSKHSSKEDRGKADQAAEVVRRLLESGPVPLSAIAQELGRQGFEDMWKQNSSRIKKRVPARDVKKEGDRTTYWELKPKDEAPKQGKIFDKEEKHDF